MEDSQAGKQSSLGLFSNAFTRCLVSTNQVFSVSPRSLQFTSGSWGSSPSSPSSHDDGRRLQKGALVLSAFPEGTELP